MKDQKSPKKRRRYDAEFKARILKMYEDGRSVSSLAEAFGIDANLIYRWKKKARESLSKAESENSEEIRQLRKRLKEVEQERDILKKALGIFSRQSRD